MICVTCLRHLRKDYHFRIIFDTFPAGDYLSIHFTWVRLQTQVISTSFLEKQHWEKQYIPLQKKETDTLVILYCKCSPFGARFVGEKGKRPQMGFPSSIGSKCTNKAIETDSAHVQVLKTNVSSGPHSLDLCPLNAFYTYNTDLDNKSALCGKMRTYIVPSSTGR